jgi:hypothetical protein
VTPLGDRIPTSLAGHSDKLAAFVLSARRFPATETELFARALGVRRKLARGTMSADCAKLGIRQIGVRSFSEAAVTERTKKQFVAQPGQTHDFFDGRADVAELVASSHPSDNIPRRK